jgi:hypothetical protein
MRLEVRSSPPGAAIVLDGMDTAALTPTVFQNVAANKEHTIELRLEGYEPYKKKLPPSPDLSQMMVSFDFAPPVGGRE